MLSDLFAWSHAVDDSHGFNAMIGRGRWEEEGQVETVSSLGGNPCSGFFWSSPMLWVFHMDCPPLHQFDVVGGCSREMGVLLVI